MTRRVTVTLPDDVAVYLDRQENPSAAVAEALRARMDRGAITAAMLRAVGIEVTADRPTRPSLPPLTAEQRAENKRRLEMLRTGTWPTHDTAAP